MIGIAKTVRRITDFKPGDQFFENETAATWPMNLERKLIPARQFCLIGSRDDVANET
jgi:hypothetical protein